MVAFTSGSCRMHSVVALPARTLTGFEQSFLNQVLLSEVGLISLW